MADQLAIQRKRKDPRHIMFRVESATLRSGVRCAVLVARFATDRRLLKERGYRVGDELRAELSKPRILGQHRKAHLIGQLCVEQLEGFEREDSHSAIKRLQRESGICCELQTIDASPVVEAILAAAQTLLGAAVTKMLRAVLPEIKTIEVSVPQSLAFDRMEQGAFEQFYRGLCGYVCAEYWPHLTADEVAAMAELMDREPAV